VRSPFAVAFAQVKDAVVLVVGYFTAKVVNPFLYGFE